VIIYIPGDVVAAWITIKNLWAQSTKPTVTALWIIFSIMLGITALWTDRTTYKVGLPRAWKQILISSGAFVIWVWATGQPFNGLMDDSEMYGAIALILYTLLSGLVV
jgi:hypothetical protein